ncbi:MAG: hypothetical protein E7244_28230 [Enterocloster citroniae]|nr:hypothetical protein [Enterocloster citroniae]
MIKWRDISIFILFILLMTGCKSQNNKIAADILLLSETKTLTDEQYSLTNRSNEQDSILNSLLNNNIREDIDSYMNLFISEYTMGSIKIEACDIPFIQTTEGAEIKRYSKNDNVIRYRIIYYGEMSKKEENYYLLDDYMYCTGMTEIYGGSITLTDAETLYRQFGEGIMIGKDFYQNKANADDYMLTENEEGFLNKEELQSLFSRSVNYTSS